MIVKKMPKDKNEIFIFLDLVDLELTSFGWCFKVVPFLTYYDHFGALNLSKKFDSGSHPK